MPFPVDVKYIEEAEKELGLVFPPVFKAKMIKENGGEIHAEDEDWILFPFFDKSNNERIRRTSNHVVRETKTAREWTNFPQEAVAIGENGGGDYLILQKVSNANNVLSDVVYFWLHETGEIHQITNSILDLSEADE